jgi:hypothetical protein
MPKVHRNDLTCDSATSKNHISHHKFNICDQQLETHLAAITLQPKPSNNMPFQPSKDSESNHSNLPINLLLSSSLFPAGSSTLDDSSASARRRGSDAQMSRSELRSVLQDALDMIDEEIDSLWGDAESSSKYQ